MPTVTYICGGITGTGSDKEVAVNAWKYRIRQIMDAVSKKDWQTVSQLHSLYSTWEPDVHLIESNQPQ